MVLRTPPSTIFVTAVRERLERLRVHFPMEIMFHQEVVIGFDAQVLGYFWSPDNIIKASPRRSFTISAEVRPGDGPDLRVEVVTN